MSADTINSVEMFIAQVKEDYMKWGNEWGATHFPWFRGQPVDRPLIPKLFRLGYNENDLLQSFRLKAPILGKTPNRKHIDEWLCLMQHCGLPTRLLDWTESALIALFFALFELPPKRPNPVVWMLDPYKMNEVSTREPVVHLSWGPQAGAENFSLAFGETEMGNEYPVAIYPAHVHMRLVVQKSCFTIHGREKAGLDELYKDTKLVTDGHLIKYRIELGKAGEILRDLRVLGISYSALFPDFDGLAEELSLVHSTRLS